MAVGVGKNCILWLNWPSDTEFGIIPPDTVRALWRIIRRCLVEDFDICLKRAESMGKPDRNPQLRPIVGGQNS